MPTLIKLPEGHAVTFETCATCGEENIRVDHGIGEDGGPLHLENCPECGESIFIVGYPCEHCSNPTPAVADATHGANRVIVSSPSAL